MLDIKSSADYLSRSGTFTNFSMLFAGEYLFYKLPIGVQCDVLVNDCVRLLVWDRKYSVDEGLPRKPIPVRQIHDHLACFDRFWKSRVTESTIYTQNPWYDRSSQVLNGKSLMNDMTAYLKSRLKNKNDLFK